MSVEFQKMPDIPEELFEYLRLMDLAADALTGADPKVFTPKPGLRTATGVQRQAEIEKWNRKKDGRI